MRLTRKPRRKESAIVNDDLARDVSEELFWDPKVDNEAIAVSADDGKVILRGTVGSLREKQETKKAAERVFGVISVDNKLDVRLMGDRKRGDAELRGRRASGARARQPRSQDRRVEAGATRALSAPSLARASASAALRSSNALPKATDESAA
jgi:hypothetical protein